MEREEGRYPWIIESFSKEITFKLEEKDLKNVDYVR